MSLLYKIKITSYINVNVSPTVECYLKVQSDNSEREDRNSRVSELNEGEPFIAVVEWHIVLRKKGYQILQINK